MLRDAEQRALAEQVGRSFWVEAPAGSGKTSLLVARYLRLLGEVDDPAEILALTFTNRAAGEMRARLALLLEAAARGETGRDEREQHLLGLARTALVRQRADVKLLGSSESLRVMTFHAFCHLLARSAPAEARLPLQAALLDEADQRVLRREVVRRALRELLHRPAHGAAGELRGGLERRLLRLNNRLDLLEGELAELIARRDLFDDLASALAGGRSDRELEDQLRERLRGLVERRLARLREALERGPLARRLGELRAALQLIAPELAAELWTELPDASWATLPAWRALAAAVLTRAGTPRRRWASRAVPPGLTAAVASLEGEPAAMLRGLRDLPDAEAPLLEGSALLDLLQLGQGMIEIYEDALRRGGALDFVELERAALRVLSEDAPSELQLFLDARIRHVLVDEFQDTSRTQWTLVCRLCAGWQRGDGRTLFLVGDPKQSIYAFRKAEVALFLQAREGIPLPGAGRLPLEPLTLATSFRSRPWLVRWCNGFFEELLRSPDREADEVAFSPCAPAVEEPDLEPRVELALFTTSEGRVAEEARRCEAAWLAATISALLREEGSAGPPSIAILPFTRAPMPQYLAACAAAGIRLQVKEGLLIKETPEGAHLLNLCRALVRPHDDFAWAALLRAPWSWQPMAVLAGLPRASSWKERVSEGAATSPDLQRLTAALEEGNRQLGRRPLADLLRGIWEALDGPAACVRLRGLQAVENGRRLLLALEQAEQGSPLPTLARLEAALSSLYEPPDPAAADSPVCMMTVHGAKGLEFDSVFVPQLDRDPTTGPPEARTPPYLLERTADGPLMAVQPDRRLADREALFGVLGDLARRRQVGEAKRLLYVAATRARRRLLLSGLVREKKEGEELAAGHRVSFMAWLLAHERIRVSAELARGKSPRSGLPVRIDPVPPTEPAPPLQQAAELPVPVVLVAEASPSRLRHPSSSGPELDGAALHAGGDEDQRARGIVIHGLLQRVAEGLALPGPRAVQAALLSEGLGAAAAEAQSGTLLEEVRVCLADSFLSRLLLQPQPHRRSEWRVEMQDGETVWTGSVDLVVDDGRDCFIIDYKTTRRREGEPAERFEARLRDHHAPQLMVYREMIIRLRGLARDRVRVGLYLTAEARWLELA